MFRRSITGGGNLQDTANHDILRALILPGYPTSMYHRQTPVNTDTEGAIESFRIQRVELRVKGFPCQRTNQTVRNNEVSVYGSLSYDIWGEKGDLLLSSGYTCRNQTAHSAAEQLFFSTAHERSVILVQ